MLNLTRQSTRLTSQHLFQLEPYLPPEDRPKHVFNCYYNRLVFT